MWRYPIFLFLLFGPAAGLAEDLTRDLAGLSVTMAPRSAEGTTAFYEARGFSPEALAIIRDTCFVGVRVVNHTSAVIWLEPGRWEFRDARGPLMRLTVADWGRRWAGVQLPAAKQATFRWTQLPDSRDLQPDEPAAGNITLPQPHGPVSATLKFRSEPTGPDRSVVFDGIVCGRAEP
jgi:hypothetical protein